MTTRYITLSGNKSRRDDVHDNYAFSVEQLDVKKITVFPLTC